jgi:hypothetical protein
MAGATVHIDSTGSGCVVGTFTADIGGRIGIGLMLVLVVPHMLRRGCCAAFMLAITGHCSPTELHRQENHEKDENPTTHCGQSVAAEIN